MGLFRQLQIDVIPELRLWRATIDAEHGVAQTVPAWDPRWFPKRSLQKHAVAVAPACWRAVLARPWLRRLLAGLARTAHGVAGSKLMPWNSTEIPRAGAVARNSRRIPLIKIPLSAGLPQCPARRAR